MMKRFFPITVLVALSLSCQFRETVVETVPCEGARLTASFAREETKTALIEGTYQWKNSDRISVRAANNGTYSMLDFRYPGEDTAGEAVFIQDDASAEGVVVRGPEGFAVYPALPESDCICDGSTLRLNTKSSYTWFNGNVEAPMIASVPESGSLQFSNLGGLLRLVYKNVPQEASRLVVIATGYEITSGLAVNGWSGGTFISERPWIQARKGSDGVISVDFGSLSAAQRASMAFYVPLPVGPGEDHCYPRLAVYLAGSGWEPIDGTSRIVSNLRIERSTIKPMPAIVLSSGMMDYQVTTLFGAAGRNNDVQGKAGGSCDEAILGCPRGIGWIVPGKSAFILDQERNVRIWDVDANYISHPYLYGDGFCVPWSGCFHDGRVWFADKARGMVFSFNPSDGSFRQELTGFSGKSPMDVKFDASGNAWLAVRDNNKLYKYDGGDFSSAPSVEVDLGRWPLVMDFDPDGYLLVTTNGCQLFKVDTSTGGKEVIAGILDAKSFSDGTAGNPLTAKFTANCYGLAIASDGTVYLGDSHRIRKLVKGTQGYRNAIVSTIAGSSQAAARPDSDGILPDTDGVGSEARFRLIGGMVLDPEEKVLYITDQGAGLVRELCLGSTTHDPSKPYRLMYWNIQNGMWSGQADNYESFVRYVKGKDPDICVWCEASTIYYAGTNNKMPASERYLTANWPALAARYGHSYVFTGGVRDNYPQVITSRYPLESVARITGEEPDSVVTHGAGWARVNLAGMALNLVSLHAWPQKYAYGATDQQASEASHGGDAYRRMELEYVCKHTVGNSDTGNWLVMGDFNSISRTDNSFYSLPSDDSRFWAQDYMLEHTRLVDIMKTRYPSDVILTTAANTRYDYVWCTPDFYPCISAAQTVRDSFTSPVRDNNIPLFYHPSDHLPIIIDFTNNNR